MTLAADWLGRLRPELAGYADLALDNLGREFPAFIFTAVNAPGDFPPRPRDRYPVFYGSFDWHSCVEMFWLLVRLLKAAPDDVPGPRIRAVLDARLTAAGRLPGPRRRAQQQRLRDITIAGVRRPAARR